MYHFLICILQKNYLNTYSWASWEENKIREREIWKNLSSEIIKKAIRLNEIILLVSIYGYVYQHTEK